MLSHLCSVFVFAHQIHNIVFAAPLRDQRRPSAYDSNCPHRSTHRLARPGGKFDSVSDEPIRAMAIEIDQDIVRGLVLVAGEPSTVGGFAQVAPPTPRSTSTVAVRIAKALDPNGELAVVVVPNERASDVHVGAAVTGLRDAGFQSVAIESHGDAVRRVIDLRDTTPTALRGCSIPQGLVDSHDGLTLLSLAPVAGGAVGALQSSADVSVDADSVGISERPDTADDDPVVVSDETETAAEDDPVVVSDDEVAIETDTAPVDVPVASNEPALDESVQPADGVQPQQANRSPWLLAGAAILLVLLAVVALAILL